ncbi:MAG TPA: hypothetical protein VFB21_10150 [Chthonomonadaceae bacterium]|nr:hypothetical protein [Chthonomonadaceae bacterium]
MSRVTVLDTGLLGLVTKRRGLAEADAIRAWVVACLAAGAQILVPEIADYEVRCELVRAGNTAAVARLDTFNADEPDRYLPLTTTAIRLAADLWAQARNGGWATADPQALDGGVIVAAQALTVQPVPTSLIVATTNAAHLSRYVTAEDWRNIVP